ncbi:MAG TPA: hypothetical protein VHD35_09530, partial [Chitinophagaceae bacterium]|nr:hypothetical protein [Chitinophagaceae bacterium]
LISRRRCVMNIVLQRREVYNLTQRPWLIHEAQEEMLLRINLCAVYVPMILCGEKLRAHPFFLSTPAHGRCEQ